MLLIYLFTWNSSVLVSEQVLKWKKMFISKHWDFNLIHIKNTLEYENNFIYENLMAESFLAEKKLIIINDLPLKTVDKEKKIKEKEEFIMNLLSTIPENNIVLFSSVNPDKRWKMYKELKKIWEVNEFNSLWEDDLSFKLNQRYPDKLKFNAVKEIIKYKWWHIDKIIPEIDKLLITKDIISKSDIVEHIHPELEESIFMLIDFILNLDSVDSIHTMDIILDTVNIHAFYSNLLSNIRTSFYIAQFKFFKVSKEKTIKALKLWKRWFLYDKNYRITFKQLTKLYISLINLDTKMKTWTMVWTEDSDFKFEIEKVLIENLT